MPWVRKQFKGGKVYALVDERGELVVRDGMVEIKYREEDERTYTTRADRVGDLGTAPAGKTGSPATAAAKRPAGADRPAAAPAARGGAARKGGRPSFQVLAHPRRESLLAYTDGACTGNPGPAGLGAVLLFGGRRKEISEYLGEGTNNIAELTAVLRALQAIRNPKLPVDLCTDSEYVIGMVARGWKAKANQELIAEVLAEAARFSDLKFVKVPAHAGVPENERADELARNAVQRRA